MTPTADPADALQAGIYALLSADAGVSALADVYDEVPEDVSAPYVVLGEVVTTDASTHDGQGRETVATLHTWTKARSFKPGNDIGAALVAALDRQAATLDAEVAGHSVWWTRHESAHTMRDPDPTLRHRVDTFRVRTSQD